MQFYKNYWKRHKGWNKSVKMADQQQISPEKKAQAGGGMSIIGIALNIAMLALGVRYLVDAFNKMI